MAGPTGLIHKPWWRLAAPTGMVLAGAGLRLHNILLLPLRCTN